MSILDILKRGARYIIKGTPVVNVRANIHNSSPANRLTGRKIVVTGGNRGLGKAMAERFVAEGADVLISGRNEDTLKVVAEEIKCKFLCYDVTDADGAENFITHAKAILGGIDTLVNNAGISLHEGDIMHVSVEQFDTQISTNLRGAYFLSKAFINNFEPSGERWGNILFISSERGQYVDDLPYGLTKAAINSLTQGLSYRLLGKGIRVNAISPGVTTSDMTGFSSEGNLSCSFYKTQRVYLPCEVAEVATFLISPQADCLSGQIIVCNNGQSVNTYLK